MSSKRNYRKGGNGMSKLKHTQGPWGYERGDEDCGYGGKHFVVHDGTECAETTICETNYGEFDARLIAAAPEMLDALVEVVKLSTRDGWLWKLLVPSIERATGLSIEEVLK
jgi:hypothetical protein